MPFYWYKGLPDCTVDIETLEKIIFDRYRAYNSPDICCKYEFEDINSIDSIGHLFMCIIANDSYEMMDIVIRGETKIFKHRLKTESIDEIHKDFEQVLEFLNKVDLDLLRKKDEEYSRLNTKNKSWLRIIRDIMRTIDKKLNHFFSLEHKSECRKTKIIVPFTFPLNLVSKREVEVKNGKVGVHCGKWNDLMENVFGYLMKTELNIIQQCKELQKCIYVDENDQLRQIIHRCVVGINGVGYREDKINKALEIDFESQFFPPCIANLHQILRRKHRLSYDSRYQYSLFLKDIGLPVDQNIEFWEEEYRKPHEGSSCRHEWEEKAKRYRYQIRHMYGLIGCRYKKSSHSCDKFIEGLSLKMDGGCPFQHLSKEDLRKSIPKSFSKLPDIEDIFGFKDFGEPRKACGAYLKSSRKYLNKRSYKSLKFQNLTEGVEINSPLNYYLIAKNLYEQVKE